MKHKSWSLVALSLGFFMVIIDVTIVNITLPSMAKGLSGGIAWLQWVVDGYTLTFACFLLSAGSLADRIGARAAFLSGLLIFIVTSMGCGLASNFGMLTFFRLLQGFGAAFIVPTSLALINASYDNVPERAKAIGIWASIGGIAAATGPLLGAILTNWFSWRAVFFVNVPIGLLALLLTVTFVPHPVRVRNREMRFDWAGQLLGIVSIAALAFSLIEAGRQGWLSSIVILSFGVFLIAVILFLWIEHRTQTPMLSLRLFKSHTFTVSVIIGLLLTLGVYGQLFVLTLYFQEVRHYSVLDTGFAFIPLVGVTALGSYYAGRIMSRIGIKTPMLIGLAIGSLGLFAMLMTGEHTPPYAFLILPLAAMGFGISFTMPAATSSTIHAAPADSAGIAAGAFNASRQIGSLLGVALFGTIINMNHAFMAGMHVTLIIAGLAYLGGFFLTVVYVKNY